MGRNFKTDMQRGAYVMLGIVLVFVFIMMVTMVLDLYQQIQTQQCLRCLDQSTRQVCVDLNNCPDHSIADGGRR